MTKLFRERMTARMHGEFVVFLIGMRINTLSRPDRWWPVTRAMGKMLSELHQQPELGFLGGEMWFGRTTIMVQYWRSFEALEQYATLRDGQHLPAWAAFRQRIGQDGAVGIWHESYLSGPGRYETIYHHMPRFGLAKAGEHLPVTGRHNRAGARLRDDN